MSFVGGKSKSTFNIIRQVNLDDSALKKIAEALGIPEAEHGQIESISGEIHIRSAPTRAGRNTTAQASDNPPSSSGGPRSPGGTAGAGRSSG